MDVSRELRAARQARGWSQRALAERAGMSRRVVEEAERGRGALTVRALDALLGTCDRTLAVEPRAATGPDDPDMVRTVRAHLHLSLAARLGRVLGAPLSLYPGAGSARWRGLCALARTRGPLRVVRGPVAVGVWVPGIVLGKGARPPLVLSCQPLGSLRREYPLWHLDLGVSQPADRLVPVPVPGARRPGRRGLVAYPPSLEWSSWGW